MDTIAEPEVLLESLTDKQRAVLDLLCEHRSSKQIARALGIAPNTVDQRINAVRSKFRTHDRAATMREYQRLQRLCGKTTYGSLVVDETPVPPLPRHRDDALNPVFMLNDSGSFDGQWIGEPVHMPVSGGSLFWGRVGRFEIIVKLALKMALCVIISLSIADALNDLI